MAVNICSAKKCGWSTAGKFCPKCGAGTIPYYTECPHCKKRTAVVNKFCEECGKPVQEEMRAFVEQKRKEVDEEREIKEVENVGGVEERK